MQTEYEKFKEVYRKVLEDLNVNFRSAKPLLVSKEPTTLNGMHRAVASRDCPQYENYFDGSEVEEYASPFDERSIIFCLDCLPEMADVQDAIFSFGECLRLNSALKQSPEESVWFFVELYKHTVELACYYELVKSPDLDASQRRAIEVALKACEAAVWELSKLRVESFEEVSPDTTYMAYLVDDWFYQNRSFKVSVERAKKDWREDSKSHDVDLFGALHCFPKTSYHEVWVVEVPVNLVDQFLLDEVVGRTLNITRFPTHVELETAKALTMDAMSVEDAIETAMAL